MSLDARAQRGPKQVTRCDDRLDRIQAMVECGTLYLPVGEVLDLADAGTATAYWMACFTGLERSC